MSPLKWRNPQRHYLTKDYPSEHKTLTQRSVVVVDACPEI